MMPSPTHMKEFTEPLEEKDLNQRSSKDRYKIKDTNQYIAKLKCSCGNYCFDILYPGDINEYGPCVMEKDGQFFFVIRVVCTHCGNDYLLFDDDYHGWNGWICHDPEKARIERPNLIKWECNDCKCTKHKAIVMINSQGKEDFIEEAGEEYDVNRWQDAFDWFTLDIKCENCGKETMDLISYETM
jgi:hypothetical protein